jgi:phosphoenolpyruvate-protein phosphotransferase (PTS system enzyme I)
VAVEIRGTAASPGVAIGPALVVERRAVTVFRVLLPEEGVEPEVGRLQRAIEASRAQLEAIKQRLARDVGLPFARIFEAQLLMLDDSLLKQRAASAVRGERVNAEWALRAVAEDLRGRFAQLSDSYLRERSADLDDVLGRIHANLSGAADGPSFSRLPGPCVLVAADLAASEAAELDWQRVLGIALDAGSATHHTSILARSLGIPAVVGLQDASRRIRPGAVLAVDGTRGLVVVEPSVPTIEVARSEDARRREEDDRLRGLRSLPAQTRDGVRIRIQANAEFPGEAATALEQGAEGIGLFRSEYLIGRSRVWPSEERQTEVYRRLLDQMSPHPVTIRTWDLGPEDLVPGEPRSSNPALGERALRLLRRAREPFLIQLRALLRAAAHGPLRIMLPFVSGLDELRAATALLAEARAQLSDRGVPMADRVPLGLNVEVPSAALTVDLLAGEVDFLSVGTNDLIQYLLAVDRGDPRVSSVYQPLHPSVLRVIRSIVQAADALRVPLGLCGEMAADPSQALMLVGLGVRELSMTPTAIPRVKAAIREVEAASLERTALACLNLRTPLEIEQRLAQDLQVHRALVPGGALPATQ